MPRYLSLYTADAASAQPSQDQMTQMGALIERQRKAGKLIATGGLKKREADGLRVRRKGGQTKVENGGAAWAAATGWALLQADSREQVIADIEEFLAVAGDGVSEIIEVSAGPDA